MKNTNVEYIYFLSNNKLMKDCGRVPECIKDMDGVVVKAHENINIGIIEDCIVDLDWCDKIPVNIIDDEELKEIRESFKDEELYTPTEKVLFDAFMEVGKEREVYKRDAKVMAKALGTIMSILLKNKKHLSDSDIAIVEAVKVDVLKTILTNK